MPAAHIQHKQSVQGKIARPKMATMESPKNVASPEVVATQRLGAGGRGQQAASPAAVLA